ncbi:site-specific integrase [Kribbella sp. NPDC056861]|uniref:tyrosine-type recombinase/integrase n=1 Tax=Kribbella sp. NPDC056861 TaxID=3154857 RepID=UPI00342A7C6F
MASRNANGEGSIYKRADGLWVGALYVDTTSGRRKRSYVYGKTRQQVHEKLTARLAHAQKGVRSPDKTWTVGSYLDYWLADVVRAKNRPRTIELYETVVRLHLRPAFGLTRLTALTVQDVQRYLNDELKRGRSARSVQQIRGVLRAALSRAEREELLLRNVAKLVEIPAWERKPIAPWTIAEAARFLIEARSHRWFPGFAMLTLYGMRRGEVLGLRWCDVDFTNNRIHIRQQLQRFDSGIQVGPVKTSAGQRDLPLTHVIRDALAALAVQRSGGDAVTALARLSDSTGLVFLSSAGTPVEPSRFYREFQDVRKRAGLRHISVHHTRHTAATILKNLKVPVRDAQLILGHAHVTTTQQLYQHADIEGQTEALGRAERELFGSNEQPLLLGKLAAVDDLSAGEGTNFAPLTSGGSTGARTRDTLLKSDLARTLSSLPQSVKQQLRARAYAQILGHAAAVNSCTDPNYPQLRFVPPAGQLDVLKLLRAADLDLLRVLSFPFNLLPPSNGPPHMN